MTMILLPPDRPELQLREVERYVRAVVLCQPHGKRAFHGRYLVLEQLQSELIACLILLLLLAYHISREYERLWRWEYLLSREGVMGGSLLLGVTVTLFLGLAPIVRWYYGVRDGVVSIAEIVSVNTTVQESTAVYTIAGAWHIMTRGKRAFRTSFKIYTRKSSSWWLHIKKGDRMLVLVHPTKPQVLVELGPVDAEPRVPVPELLQDEPATIE